MTISAPAPQSAPLESKPTRALPPRDRWSGYAGAGAGLLALGLVLAAVVANVPAGADLSDLPINRWAFGLASSNSWLEGLAMVFQNIGTPKVATVVGVVFAVVLLVLKRWRWATFFIASSIGGVIITEVVKHSVERVRPVWADPLYPETGFSFPSGHTTSGITCWVAMGVVLLFLLPRPWSTVVGWIVIAFGVLMGPSRVFLGVHWFTDVLGGWIFGFGWVLLVAGLCLRRWGAVPAVDPPPAGAIAPPVAP